MATKYASQATAATTTTNETTPLPPTLSATPEPPEFLVAIHIQVSGQRHHQVTRPAKSAATGNNSEQPLQAQLVPSVDEQPSVELISWALIQQATGERQWTRTLDLLDGKLSLAEAIRQIDASLPESCALLTCGPHHLRQYLYPIARRLKVHLNDKYTRYFDLLKEFDRHQSLVQLKTMQEAAAATTTYCCWQPAPAAASFAATCCDICAAVDPTMYLAQVPLLDRHGSGLISGEPSEQSHPPAGQQQHQQQQHQAGRNWRLEEILKSLAIDFDLQTGGQCKQRHQSGGDDEASHSADQQPAVHCSGGQCAGCLLAANERQLEATCLIVSRLLSQGHRFNRFETIKRQVEVGLCVVSSKEADQCIVRARGLPWQATEQDIADFFVGLNISKGGVGLCLSRQGRRNGEALIQFESREQRNLALGRHKHFMGARYIEVYRASADDFLSVATGYNNRAQAFLSKGAQVIIRMRGLPFTCTAKQVVDFFASPNEAANNKQQKQAYCQVLSQEDGVLFVKNHDDKPTGDAFVLFASEEAAQKALAKHHQNIGSRYVELFRSTISEVQQVLSISMEPTTMTTSATITSTKATNYNNNNNYDHQQQVNANLKGSPVHNDSQQQSKRQTARRAEPMITYAQVANSKQQQQQQQLAKKEQQQPTSTTNESQSNGISTPSKTTKTTCESNKPGQPLSTGDTCGPTPAEAATLLQRQQTISVKSGDESRPASGLIRINGSGGGSGNGSSSEMSSLANGVSSGEFVSASDENSSTSEDNVGAVEQQQQREATSEPIDDKQQIVGSADEEKTQPSATSAQLLPSPATSGSSSQAHSPISSSSSSSMSSFNSFKRSNGRQAYGNGVSNGANKYPNYRSPANKNNYAVDLNNQQSSPIVDCYGQLNGANPMLAAHHHHHHHPQHLSPAYHHHHHHQMAYLPAPPPPLHQHQHHMAHFYQQQQTYIDPSVTSRRDCIRLRGLPYEAQVEDVLFFLGKHSENIVYQGVHMVYSSQGQPTGEAIIQMNSCRAATAAAQKAHKNVMSVGKKQRYIEVIPSSIDDMKATLGLGLATFVAGRAYMPTAAPASHAYQQHVYTMAATQHYPAPSSNGSGVGPETEAASSTATSVTDEMPAAATTVQDVSGGGSSSSSSGSSAADEQQIRSASESRTNTASAASSYSASANYHDESDCCQVNNDHEQQSLAPVTAPDQQPLPPLPPSTAATATTSTTTLSGDHLAAPPVPASQHQHHHHHHQVAAAQAAAAYYPILYYYHPQQMLATPYH